jgi:glutathione synthase/RimK-type ligase-like ATP-grasp enzyme
MRELFLVTGNKGFFGQTRKPWVSMDSDRLQYLLEQQGFSVEQHCFHELVNRDHPVRNSMIFYSFSQKPNRRQYILDLVSYLASNDNVLIPSYELLKCHENKGYQELHKRSIGIPTLPSLYLSSVRELDFYHLDFPLVLKATEGSNAKRVYLIHNLAELQSRIKRLSRQSLFARADLLRRKHFRGKKEYKEYPQYSNKEDYEQYRDYILQESNFILQKFIPGIDYDFRVLVLYDRYYVTKRHAREGDFRASGAKRFDFAFDADPRLLDYAKWVYAKFDTPFFSMDICPHDGRYELLEYQALHFGINVFMKSTGYYRQSGDTWVFNQAQPDIERGIAEGVAKFVESRFPEPHSVSSRSQ